MSDSDDSAEMKGNLFPPTNWSLVLKANGNSHASKAAIDALCATYWKPICAYVRYLGMPDQDAEDLTQDFFHQLLVRRNLFKEVQKEKGRLRTFVCVAVKRLVTDEYRKRATTKRGGGTDIVSLDLSDPTDTAANTPDRQFDKAWAEALIERALLELECDYTARGKEELFKELRDNLGHRGAREPQEESAQKLGMTLNAVRMSYVRMRRQFGELFQKQVAQTIAPCTISEVKEEIRYLMELFE